MDDPLIPTEGTIAYYISLLDHFGSADAVNRFCRMYITPGDSHGNCWENGPGITESDGMKALMAWVEQNNAPQAIRTVQVSNKDGSMIEESSQMPWKAPLSE